jgi:cation diffusion facilitator family transporter
MTTDHARSDPDGHSHFFLSQGHEHAERRTWVVIWICGAMMALEIVGGALFGSIALVADGLHMSTHAGALLLAALAYSYARRHANDRRFSFGTGKLGDLAGFTSAIVLAMIAIFIGWEAVNRFFSAVAIHFREAIPIAFLGLGVNVVSAWILSRGGDHHHGHGHGRGLSHGEAHHQHDEGRIIPSAGGNLVLSVFEQDHPPVFRLRAVEAAASLAAEHVSIETLRPGGARQTFSLQDHGGFLQSLEEIPEPHAFTVTLRLNGDEYPVEFSEHEHGAGATHRDNNMRAAIIHVMADAAVSVLVIIGLMLASAFGWLWMDPIVGIAGACVIASWSYGLVRDTGAILLDMCPDNALEQQIRRAVEESGDCLKDLHLWRVGPGHLSAIVSVVSGKDRDADFYRQRLARFHSLSHVTIEVRRS